MGRKRIKGTKYNRVTKQQKYVFLKLCIAEKQSIHEAAFNAGIHYSTAKTILFFHKKQYKNYATYIVDGPHENEPSACTLRAVWKDIPIDVDAEKTELSKIEIVVNSKAKMLEERMKNKELKDSTSEGKDSNGMDVKIQYDFLQYPLKVQQLHDPVLQQRENEGIKQEVLGLTPKMEFQENLFY